MYIGFCVAGTVSIYFQGAFEFTASIVGTLILVAFYLLVAFVLYVFVKKNPDQVEKLFRK